MTHGHGPSAPRYVPAYFFVGPLANEDINTGGRPIRETLVRFHHDTPVEIGDLTFKDTLQACLLRADEHEDEQLRELVQQLQAVRARLRQKEHSPAEVARVFKRFHELQTHLGRGHQDANLLDTWLGQHPTPAFGALNLGNLDLHLTPSAHPGTRGKRFADAATQGKGALITWAAGHGAGNAAPQPARVDRHDHDRTGPNFINTKFGPIS